MTTVGIATGAGRGMGLSCACRLADAVDHLLLVDRDEATLAAGSEEVVSKSRRAVVEPVVLDVTDRDGLARLAQRSEALGTLRSISHAAGISPTMADWKRVLTVDLVGTAMLAEALRPLATTGTAMVCFASMAPRLGITHVAPEVDAALDAPLDDRFLDRVREAVGAEIENAGIAYSWAKRGVIRFVQQEAVRLGPVGARVCSVSPGIIDTPQGRQEAESHPFMDVLVQRTPLGRVGTSDEVAAVVAFLLSDEARFVSGVDVLVDGGVVAAMVGPA